jgi:hypothetical protein
VRCVSVQSRRATEDADPKQTLSGSTMAGSNSAVLRIATGTEPLSDGLTAFGNCRGLMSIATTVMPLVALSLPEAGSVESVATVAVSS